jgi:hypothetical protein
MVIKKDGGPAFPFQDEYSDSYSGMSLRDWFASQVLIGLITSNLSISPPSAASKAYSIADIMLVERKKGLE